MKKKIYYSILLALFTIVLVSCGGNKEVDSDTPLIFSSQEVDEVFNPFYSSSQPDSEIVSMTQLSMLSSDAQGKVAYGENEATVVLDYTEQYNSLEDTTTYSFVLKNNIKFSNGSPLTIRDVLFNLYVYLDPVYTGSSTIYSTDIVGLKQYRTQESDEGEQDAFMEQFYTAAEERIQALADAADEITDEGKNTFTEAEFKNKLNALTSQNYYKNVVKDFEKVQELFKEELETDFNNNKDSASDIVFMDPTSKVQYKGLLSTDVEAFLYAEGFLKFNYDDKKLESSFGNTSELKTWTKEQAIQKVYEAKMPNDLVEIIYYWATATKLNESLVNDAMSSQLANGEKVYKNISGIQFANRTSAVTVNGKEYAAVEYAEDGSVKNSTNEVLQITINEVDPKAIWNFGFVVAPMFYYSNEEQINKFDFESNFGVEYASTDFQTKVIKNPDKISLPVGAGPYQVSNSRNEKEGITASEFCDIGMIYFTRNDNYLMGAPKIKNIRYRVTSSSQLLQSLYTGEIHYGTPNATPENVAELNGKVSDGIESKNVSTQGYGYIGVNAAHVPSIYVRQAIMHSMNTELCVQYYGTSAQAIHRSMSLNSWAYPEGVTPYYPFIGGKVPTDLTNVNPLYRDYIESITAQIPANRVLTEAQQDEFIRMMLEDYAGYEKANGIYTDRNNVCKYTFTIAGQDVEHPAYGAMVQAAEILNRNGFEVIVKTDINALSKLTTGDLQVWAAAWSSTIDPDMYQVYHKDSTATSVNNWGYKAIKANVGGKYDTELALVEELSEWIEKGRETTNQTERAQIYAEALDVVMQLAVELPTYQRDDLFAYNTKVIDKSSFVQNPSPLRGLTSEIWNLKLNVES